MEKLNLNPAISRSNPRCHRYYWAMETQLQLHCFMTNAECWTHWGPYQVSELAHYNLKWLQCGMGAKQSISYRGYKAILCWIILMEVCHASGHDLICRLKRSRPTRTRTLALRKTGSELHTCRQENSRNWVRLGPFLSLPFLISSVWAHVTPIAAKIHLKRKIQQIRESRSVRWENQW